MQSCIRKMRVRLRHVCATDLQPVTEQQVRDARRAYYGAISFVDEQIGILRATLEAAGLADDTVTVFTSDHGEMLGERGLWYKMSFFEDACRVPLMVHAPGRLPPRVTPDVVSLVDLLPTFCELASAEPPAACDGRSLVPQLHGTTGHNEAIGSYCGEGAVAPIAMIRRGDWKYVHSPADPDQLYDLESDPDELENLASLPVPPPALDEFCREVRSRFDFDALHADVLASQSRRRLIGEAMQQGRRTSWDYAPPDRADSAYIRSHKSLESLEADARLPSRLASLQS